MPKSPLKPTQIRLKCVISTAIVVNRGSGRQSLLDEVQLFDEGAYLSVSTPEIARRKTSAYTGARSGPTKSPSPLPSAITSSRRTPSPPRPPSSSVARATCLWKPHPSATTSVSSTSLVSLYSTFRAEVTLARQGLLRPNDRLFIPIAYIKHQEPTTETRDRALAHLEGRSLHPLAEEPNRWAGRSLRQECSKSMFSRNRKAWYDVVGLLPTPAVFDRHS
jgi:hypothetical protein